MDLRGVFSLWGFPRYGTEAEQYAADHLEDRPDLTDAANDEWQKYWTNAFAHTYASAMIAYHYDADTARTLGNTRENIQTMWGYLGGDPPRVGAYMDLGSNEVGIQIGQIARERGWPESAIPWLVEQAANQRGAVCSMTGTGQPRRAERRDAEHRPPGLRYRIARPGTPTA